MIWGLAAYLMWGVFPAFFPLLKPAAPVEILPPVHLDVGIHDHRCYRGRRCEIDATDPGCTVA